MCIVRIPKRNTHFVQIDNNSLSDPSLSMKAKGLLSYLLSCSDNWIIRISHLMKHFSDGKTAIRSALKELETCGYLKRERVNEKGHIEWRQTVYESPALNPDWIPAKDSRPTAPAQHSTPSKQTELLDVPASSKKENEPPVPQVKKEKPQQTLSFKLDFSEQQKEVMSSMLKGIDNAQQLILVLEQMVNQNEIKNPVAYLAGIIKKYRANQFTPLEEEKQKAAAEREAKRKAGVKDCPYCHVDDGFVVFEEPNGHKSSRLCNHDEAGILKTARDLDAKIVTSKIIKENEPPAKAEQNVPVVLIPVSQDLGFDDEIEVERQAGIKDCPFCDDNGV
ncbi:MAG: helix-turn-helix domain-containing protein, partial [Pseudomonadota bacterium]